MSLARSAPGIGSERIDQEIVPKGFGTFLGPRIEGVQAFVP